MNYRTTKDLYDLMKLGNFKEISEMLEFDAEYSSDHPKRKFKHLYQKITKG